MKRRHRFMFRLLYFVAGPILRWKFGYRSDKIEKLERPTIFVANHVTDLDPALVGIMYGHQIYFVCSEHAFRWGWLSKLLVWALAPIPRVKGTADTKTVMDILRIVKGGGHAGIFVEGVRSYSGLTNPIVSSTGKLIRMSGADMITIRLEGGYFTSPGWSKSMRKGRMYGRVIGHYTKEQLKAMSANEIDEIMRRDIDEDAYKRQMENPVAYRGKDLAEYMELALYMCPRCGRVGTMHSSGDHLRCECGLDVLYTPYGMLEGVDVPFKTATQWDMWQREQLPDYLAAADDPFFIDEDQELYRITPLVDAQLVGRGRLQMDKSAITCADQVFPLSAISGITLYGSMKTLAFTTNDGQHYEIKSPRYPRCAAKYELAYNILKGKED